MVGRSELVKMFGSQATELRVLGKLSEKRISWCIHDSAQEREPIGKIGNFEIKWKTEILEKV